MTTILELKDINKYYGNGENKLHVLKNINISIEKGVVSEELVSDKENMGAEEEYYTNDYPVPYAYVSDKSLLQ